MLGCILPPSAVALLPFLPLAIAVAFLPLGTAFTFPCVTSLLSRVISSKERGLYMGVQQTFGGMARVAFPILFGFLYDRSSGLPFLVSAALVMFTVYLGLGMEAYGRADPKTAAA
jgi:cyanate permease